MGRVAEHPARCMLALFALSPLTLACASASSPAAAGEVSIRLAQVDASASSRPREVSSALRVHADRPLVACQAQARDAGSSGHGHMDLSVAVDDKGSTVAAVLHATMSDYAITECVARALSGATVPTDGQSYRIRVRVEIGG